ncbi:MAG: hypothetical protein K5905_31120, partial [Roseibium sp.]|uniref:hypothetical protein n=1 Tax=Roseibium sp. TaxID=1936156 RepID=UPI0026212A16
MARSPSYPSIPLEKAVELAGGIYEGAQRSHIDPETAYELMGYSGKTGASLSALAALKHYGLIEGRSDSLRITSLGERILNPMDEDERCKALFEAGYNPTFFQELRSEFGEVIPADNVIRALAMRKHGFSKFGADGVAKSYGETIRFLSRFNTAPSAVVDTSRDDEPSGVHIRERQIALTRSSDDAIESNTKNPINPERTTDENVIEVPIG